jgi:hypothetical protein
MANDPLRRTRPRPAPTDSDRPNIWAEGEQRPPFSFPGLRRATLSLSRDAVAPLNAWAARATRRVAVNVAGGAGRIPEGKLGRVERFVPSHLRVAGWIKNSAAVMAHASAVADPDVKRGNALVAEIEPHLWPLEAEPLPTEPAPEIGAPAASPFGADAPPVVLAEPLPPEPEPDPLAAIRDDLDGTALPGRTERKGLSRTASGPALPPDPPGPVASTAIQMTGYLMGWATVILALPFGLVRALWLWLAKNVDLRRVGLDD